MARVPICRTPLQCPQLSKASALLSLLIKILLYLNNQSYPREWFYLSRKFLPVKEFCVMGFLVLWSYRMYQVLVAAGDSKSAKEIDSMIPNDDRDVRCIIKESRVVFTPKPKKKMPKRKRLSCQAK